jgi:hypothetical protein
VFFLFPENHPLGSGVFHDPARRIPLFVGQLWHQSADEAGAMKVRTLRIWKCLQLEQELSNWLIRKGGAGWLLDKNLEDRNEDVL